MLCDGVRRQFGHRHYFPDNVNTVCELQVDTYNLSVHVCWEVAYRKDIGCELGVCVCVLCNATLGVCVCIGSATNCICKAWSTHTAVLMMRGFDDALNTPVLYVVHVQPHAHVLTCVCL